MSESNNSGVIKVLKRIYGPVPSLEEYLGSINFSDGQKPVLVQESDPVRYKSLIQGLIVCTDSPLTQPPSSAQLCTLSEVLAFVLNRMKMKKKRNVLSFGYTVNCIDADPFKFHGCVSQSAALISGSETWTKINERLGSDLTQHLLSRCAVFISAPPTCLVQICGVPLYDLVPVQTWSGFYLNPRSKMTTNIQKVAVRNLPVSIKRKHKDATQPKYKAEEQSRSVINAKKRKREETNNEGEEENSLPAKQRFLNTTEFKSNVKTMAHVASPTHGLSSWKTCDQAPPRPSHCFISVLNMLYGGFGMKGFLLNRKIKEKTGAARPIEGADLVKMVFHLEGETLLSVTGSRKSKWKLPKRFFTMLPLFSQLLRRHRTCPYSHILSKKCGVGAVKEDMTSLLASHCSFYRVYLFVRDCVKFVIPDELWGSQTNMLLFLSNVKNFLRLGKFEKVSLAQMMWRMKVSACRWLGNKKSHCPSEHRYREWIFGQFLLWMINDFVIGLVKSSFYVTESVGNKHALRFYRHPIWVKLQDLAFREHLSKGQWEEMTPSAVTLLPKNTVTSRIRFIPKANGMRPITRIISTGAALQFQSSVRDLQNVLSACVRERPDVLGSTVWGRQDIHRALRSITHSETPLYFVKVDVSGAYDSLPHSKLLEVVHDILKPKEKSRFSLRHYARVYMDSSQTVRKQFYTKAEPFELSNMKGFVIEEQKSGKIHNSILVEKLSLEVKGADVFQFFKQMLNSYIIQYNRKVFRQVCGIPQGSTVSTMLCNLCYGHMESRVLKNITEKGGCLMRLVDDFLLITPRLNNAIHFLKTLMKGIPDYGCVINPQKVAVNFSVANELSLADLTEFPAHCLFPWCGLLIDTCALHVYNDYAGYAGQSLRYSLTLGSTHSPAVFMKNKLLRILRLKCDNILLDLQLNSVEAVYSNIYKILLLQAMRFHVCVKSLPLGQGVGTNPGFFLIMIWSMATITNRNITQSNAGVPVQDVLQKEAVELLCCLAFEVVLKCQRPSYSYLLPHISKRKRRLLSILRGIRLARVLQAATPRIPPDFTTIHI